MGVTITGHLTDELSAELQHEQGAKIDTTAPKDNGGTGGFFSPTDMLAASLGACGIITMSLYAQRHGISVEKMEFKLQKEMSSTPPRRVAKITVEYVIKTTCNDEVFKKLMASAKACPVRNSLSPDVHLEETFQRIL